jgi:hypothetical protein
MRRHGVRSGQNFATMGIATYLVFAGLERKFTRWATRRQETQFGGG